ncbi:MAG: EpsG family protein [Bacteroidales bacterium]|nr:EpsG family protein [Bacteroidales bacterium]
MSLYLFLFMFLLGYVCTIRELSYKQNKGVYRILFFGLFVLTAISRVGHSYDYSDLTNYVDYFKSGNLAYFEIGYVWLTDLIDKNIGTKGVHLVFVVSMWTLFFASLSVILNKLEDSKSFLAIPKSVIHGNLMSGYYTLVFMFSVYWGLAYAAEGLRNGLATSLLLCSASLCISGYIAVSLIPIFIATLFHSSAIAFLIVPMCFLFVKNILKKSILLKWFITLLIFDVIMQATDHFNATVIFSRAVGIDLAATERLLIYKDSDVGNYFSTQYITYHLIGYIMLLGPLDEKRYNKSVLIFFIGLTMGSLFQTTAIVMRIQWLFFVMSVFSIYYMGQSQRVRNKTKAMVITLLSIVQAIMILRYLGYYY